MRYYIHSYVCNISCESMYDYELNNSSITTNSRIGNNTGDRTKKTIYCVNDSRFPVQLNKLNNISSTVIVKK